MDVLVGGRKRQAREAAAVNGYLALIERALEQRVCQDDLPAQAKPRL